MPRSDARVALLLGLVMATLYVAAGLGHPTIYDYYARLADAFLHGRYWLTEAPAYLNELLPCGPGRLCVVYGVMPAFVTLPFLAVFNGGVAQSFAAAVAGGASAGPAYLVLRRLGTPARIAILVTVFGSLGTTLLFSSSDGRSWFMAHSVAVLFATLALLAAVDVRPGWVVGALLACATLARFPVALAAPGLALLVARRRGEPFLRSAALLVAGAAPFAILELGYNVLRWGVPTEAGFMSLTVGDYFFSDGLLSLSYLPRHLYAIFVQAPDLVWDSAPFVRPTWVGESLVLTSPALFLAVPALRFARARAEVVPLALAAAFPLVPDVLHGTVGFAQFGYRFSLDAQPFLLPLVALGAAYASGRWVAPGAVALALGAWSILANVYGTIVITQLGYVR